MRTVITRLSEITGNIASLEASDVGLGELAVITSPGRSTPGQVIRIADDRVTLQVFGGTKGISTNDQVRFLGHPMRVKYGPSLLGRIMNGSGRPIDGGPEPVEEEIEIGGPSFNPANRIIPRAMIRTNIPMIDLFNSLVVSQKLPIFSVPGEPYNQVLARVGMQAEAEIIILGAMGIKFDDYTFSAAPLSRAAGHEPGDHVHPTWPRTRWWNACWCPTWPWRWPSASPRPASGCWSC